MPDGNIHYQGFMSAIQEKISHKATLVNRITDLLAIDKDAVYRRLRGEVNFSFAEMALIARNLGVSLDTIAGIENLQSKPSKINISRQIEPTDYDYEMFEGHLNLLKSIKDEPDTQIIETGNTFPHYIFYDYESLSRFYLFKWNQIRSSRDGLPFHEIVIEERLRNLQIDTCKYARHIKATHYVWDNMIFQRLVDNIKYFARVRLIKEEDVALLKNDLISLLNHVENMAIQGKHEETGNEVSIFISDMNTDMKYSCLKSKNIQLTLFWIYILNAIVSMDIEVFNETYTWIQSLQRMSTSISVSGEKFRANFLEKQRMIIAEL